jgi:hypothetical protein
VSRKLVVIDGSRERELMLVGRLVVGRDPACDITYDDALLSRRHAEFVAAGDQVTVRDLGSRNGVFVNGAKIAERALRSGDVVQIGPVRARYVADDAPVSITPDEVDADHTAVLHRAPKPAAAAAAYTDDDDDRTRVTPPPRRAQPSDLMAGTRLPAVDDDDRTEFLRPPSVAAKSTVEPAAPALNPQSIANPQSMVDAHPDVNPELVLNPQSAIGNRQSAIRDPQSAIESLSTFVFVRSLALAAIVLAAAAVPLVVWRRAVAVDQTAGAPILWLAVAVAVALIATYFISAQINRRIVHALTVGRERS